VFFAVSVVVANYHIFSKWLSLLVKPRSSQAVKKFLDLSLTWPAVRHGTEMEVPAEQVAARDRMRIQPGEGGRGTALTSCTRAEQSVLVLSPRHRWAGRCFADRSESSRATRAADG
jgi:hypothetical protein